MDPLTTRVKKKKKKYSFVYTSISSMRARNFVSRGDSRRGIFFPRASSFVSCPRLIDRLSLRDQTSSTGFDLGWGGNSWIAMRFEFSNFRKGIWILLGQVREVIAYAVCQLRLSLRRKSATLISKRSDLLSFRVERDIRGKDPDTEMVDGKYFGVKKSLL